MILKVALQMIREMSKEPEWVSHVPFGSKPFQKYRQYPFEPGKVYDGGLVQNYIFSMQSPEDFAEARRIADFYTLKEIDPKSLEDRSLVVRDDDNPGPEADYAELKTPFPPIVLDRRGRIIDGNHRLIAAILRGDKTIRALVPCKKPSGEAIHEGRKTLRQQPGEYTFDELAAFMPTAVVTKARTMYEKVAGKTALCGDSDTVAGWWIETHTLGCRNAADEPEEQWEDSYQTILDEYLTDRMSYVVIPEDFIFISITPQRR